MTPRFQDRATGYLFETWGVGKMRPMERMLLSIQVQSAREHFVSKLPTEYKGKTPTYVQLFALLFTDYSGLPSRFRQ